MRSSTGLLRASALALALSLAGCGQDSPPAGTTTAAEISTPAPVAHPSRARHRARRAQRRPATHGLARARLAAGLPISSASASDIQPQPAPGSCHARGSGLYSEPDPRCTPGALNPQVKQATIARTICMSGWTRTVRPPTSVTEPEKLASMAAYGDGDSARDYEYDHLVSLELGGAVNDPRNLWPEPGSSPNPKDGIENALHRMVCEGAISLARAQHIIAREWVSWARTRGAGGEPTPRTAGASTPPAPPSAAGEPDKPVSEVNCSDFATHAAAQRWFERHGGSAGNDVAGLDGNHDGVACSSLP
jgi:hypothetical protein